jgi:hypothetical protein
MMDGWMQNTIDYVFGRVPTPEERIVATKKSLAKLQDEYEDKCADIEYEQKQLEKKMDVAARRQNEKELKLHARKYVRYEIEHTEYSKQAERTSDFIVQVDKLKMDATFNDAISEFALVATSPMIVNTGKILQSLDVVKRRKESRKIIEEEIDEAFALSSEEEDEDEETNQRVAELVGEKLQQANATLIEKLPVIRAMSPHGTKNENPDLVARKVEQFLAKK